MVSYNPKFTNYIPHTVVYLPSIPDPYTLVLKNAQLSQDGIYRNMLLAFATLYSFLPLLQ